MVTHALEPRTLTLPYGTSIDIDIDITARDKKSQRDANVRPVSVAQSTRMDEDTNSIEAQEACAVTRPQRVSGLRRFFQAHQLYESVQPIFAVTFWHGLTPFFIKSDGAGNKKLKESIFGYLNTLIHITVYVACYVLTLLNDFETVAGYFFHTGISRFGDTMQILSGLIGITVIFFTAILPKHRLQYSLSTMQDIDVLLRSVGVHIRYSKVLRYCYLSLLVVFVVDFAYSFGNFILLKSANLEPSTPLYIVFTLQHTVISIATAMFQGITKMVEMRLVMLNKVRQLLSSNTIVLFASIMHFWKELFSPTDAYSASQTLLWFNFLLGLTPFRIHGTMCGQRTLRISRLGYLNTLLQVIFFMYCFIHSLAEQASIVGFFFKSEISQVGDTLQKFIGLLGMLTLFGISLSECRVIVSLCNTVAYVDKRFLNIGVTFNYQYIMKLTHMKMFLISGALTTYLIILLQFTSSNTTEQHSPQAGPNTTTLMNLLTNTATTEP
ncbi:putative gustatory receptor 28b [Rhagoletis pomonella]|uniref:putative gustatory receptor 28b n=1 Tax=Rhagoletis pomonella TaxID=28610 RepID=UPI00177C9874|nr:putative gustatory receptor 28b [Rhagoletis pomonella]